MLEASGAEPQIIAERLFRHQGQAEGDQQAEDGVGRVEAAQQEALEQHAEQAHQHRRDEDAGAEAGVLDDLQRQVGAQRVEGAVRQVDDAADAEDQRQAQASSR